MDPRRHIEMRQGGAAVATEFVGTEGGLQEFRLDRRLPAACGAAHHRVAMA